MIKVDMQKERRPLVSVVIITYNREALIRRSIESVLQQTYRNFELIIVDDGSTDHTRRIAISYTKLYPKVFYVRHTCNKGISAARNTGISKARGEYIAFQDSDDEWLPEKLALQVKVFQKNSDLLGMVYSDMWRITHHRQEPYYSPKINQGDRDLHKWALDLQVKNIGIGSTLIRKEVWNKTGLFDENLQCLEDMEFFIRLSKYYGFQHINQPLVKYYQSGDNLTDNLSLVIQSLEYILQKHFSEIQRYISILSRHYLRIARYYLLIEKKSEGWTYFKKALKTYPFILLTKMGLVDGYLCSFGVFEFRNCQKNYLSLKQKYFKRKWDKTD